MISKVSSYNSIKIYKTQSAVAQCKMKNVKCKINVKTPFGVSIYKKIYD